MKLARANPDIARKKSGSVIAASLKRRFGSAMEPLPAAHSAALANSIQSTKTRKFRRLSHGDNMQSIFFCRNHANCLQRSNKLLANAADVG
jgi:hypothetical protein